MQFVWIKNTYKIVDGKCDEREHLGYLGSCGLIILKRMLKEYR